MASVTAVALFFVYMNREPTKEVPVAGTTLALLVCLSFLLGCFCSALAGYMDQRPGQHQGRHRRRPEQLPGRPQPDALKFAFCGGAVSSIVSAAMCILGLALQFAVLYTVFVRNYGLAVNKIPTLMVGYGFGASFVALFMQLGGKVVWRAWGV